MLGGKKKNSDVEYSYFLRVIIYIVYLYLDCFVIYNIFNSLFKI